MSCPYHCINCPFTSPIQYDYANTYFTRNVSPSNPININPKEITLSNDKIKENLRVPVVQGNIDPRVLNQINSGLENDIMEFKQQMESSADEGEMDSKKLNKPFEPYVISNVYAVTYNKNNILSLSLIYEELINRRHYYIRTSYNYDLCTGKSLSVGDMFKPGTDVKTLINTEIRKELATGKASYMPNAAQNFKGIADDQPFFIDGENLNIFLSFNEVAPLASEIPSVKIPMYKLRNYLKPEFLRSRY